MADLDLDFHHAGICVADLEAAIEWYDRVLDFTLERRSLIAAVPAKVAMIRHGDLRIELFEAEGSAALPDDRRYPNRDLMTQGNKHVAFRVADLPATRDRLIARGAEIALDYQDRVFFIRDNTGNLIEFVRYDV